MCSWHTKPTEVRNERKNGHSLQYCRSKWEGKDPLVKLHQCAFPETEETLGRYTLAVVILREKHNGLGGSTRSKSVVLVSPLMPVK